MIERGKIIMKFKKALTGLLSVTVLAVSTTSVFAASARIAKSRNSLLRTDIIPISAELEAQQKAYYGYFNGIVKEISDFNGTKDSKFVSVESKDGAPANIIISNETYILDNAEISVGSEITAYFRADAPMIMIYPPQYGAEVVVVNNNDQNVKVEMFDENLVSFDNLLKLNISDDTEIISQDGKEFEGELANRKLVVVYDVSTKSIPAQTNPIKIVVLDDVEEPTEHHLTEEEIATLTNDDVAAMDVVVNNNTIKAMSSYIPAYINEQGIIMVPLRAISETLGFEVTWNNDTKTAMLNGGISLTLGIDEYARKGKETVKLEVAPSTVEDRTFVPLSFFSEVAQIDNVYVTGSQIVIENVE